MGKENREIRFTKMHGAGNDYIYLNGMSAIPDDLPELARRISDRHFGVGSDGLVVICPSEKADFRMRMFNADGSEAQMCGNASRCIARYVFERGLTDKKDVTLETLAGIKTLHINEREGKVVSVTVDMGEPCFEATRIPAHIPGRDRIVNEQVTIDGTEFRITAVGTGNPHGVIFVDEINDGLVLGYGPKLERAGMFPENANIEFVKVNSRKDVDMRVWERGSGETLACGTGSCATVAACVANGMTDREVDVHLLGGTLHINWDDTTGHLMMTGPAEFVCDGVFYIPAEKEQK